MNGHSKRPLLKTHNRSYSTEKLSKRWSRVRNRSLLRILAAAFLVAVAVQTLRVYLSPGIDLETLRHEANVLGNCASIEPLRQADECFEAFDFSRGRRRKPTRQLRKQSAHLEHEEDIPWISSYGLVLDYDATYDRFSQDSDLELYTTKRTLKCLTGFHMSIVWDLEFSIPLIDAYKAGKFGLDPNTTNTVAASCPSTSSESSASMSIKINCGFDIQRDLWGHPAGEADHEELETCLRLAWSWVKGRVGDQSVLPFKELCHEGLDNAWHCKRDVFHLEGSD